MADSLHEISIAAPVERVFAAWTTADGLASWWTSDCRVAKEVGGENVFGFQGHTVLFHFHIDALAAPHHVQWTGVAGPGMPDEWIGTTIDVRLISQKGGTRVRFSHRDWRSADGSFRACNTTWGELLYRLRDACEGREPGPLFR